MALIIIPSYRRAERLLSTINTTTSMPDSVKKETVLFVREEERAAYEHTADALGVGLVSFEPSHQPFGWGHTMDAIFDKYTQEQERFIVMDDDLALYSHHQGEYSGINWNAMLACLLSVSDDIPLASILARQFSQNHKEPLEYNTRLMQVFSVYSPAINDTYRFARDSGMFYMTDVYFTLNTLRHGIKNKVYTNFVRNDVPNTPGGCLALGRNAETHALDAKRLKQLFPTLVNLYEKEATKWEKGTIGTRISWKGAFRSR